MSFTNLLSKAIGGGAIFLSLKDAHTFGTLRKNEGPNDYISKTYPDAFINSQQLDAQCLPSVVSDAKKSWFNFLMDDSYMPAIYGFTGYVRGFTKQIVNNVIPISLGLGSIMLKKRGNKICAGLLALGALKMTLLDIFNIGKSKKI